MSLDHSHLGFYEGFGLTVLESALFGVPSIVYDTGGLPEAVHHLETGIVLPSQSKMTHIELITPWLNEFNYQKLSRGCYQHTLESHSLREYKVMFGKIFNLKEIA